MADITMCINDLCEHKDKCLRFTAKPNEEGYQSYMHYVCDWQREYYFIPNDEQQI